MQGSLLFIVAFAVAARAWAGVDVGPEARAQADALVAAGVPAILIGVTGGEEVAVEGFGMVDGKRPDQDTIFQLGSVTKTFTALLLADAVGRGLVDLGHPVNACLPGFGLASYQGHPIRLLDLANQSSGLPRLPGNLVPAHAAQPYADYGLPELKAFAASWRPERAPGTYTYSNLGYAVLGLALTGCAGADYESLLHERIAVPLGLRDTTTILSTAQAARLAPGHDGAGRAAPAWDMHLFAPAGGIFSTARDLLRYVGAHLHPAGGSAYALVRQPQGPTDSADQGIGLAWHLRTVDGRAIVWHNGMTGGYASFVAFTADGRRGVVVLANAAVNVDALGVAALLPPAPVAPLGMARQAEYAGSYQLAPGFVLEVRATPAGLVAQATGQGAAVVYPAGKDTFAYRIVAASLVFERDASGQIVGLALHQGGRVMPAPRIGAH